MITQKIYSAYKKTSRRLNKKILFQSFIKNKFFNKEGIEIGGPSLIFQNNIPLYRVAKKIDGCNFSDQTLWEGKIQAGDTYNYFEEKKGRQFIREASDLFDIENNTYDFLLASHCLEHCANVIKTVLEWKRVIKSKGYLLLILPAKDFTFDNRREISSFAHLLEDYKKNVGEDDLTHLQEIIGLHDIAMDKGIADQKSFVERSKKNLENRALHHHVFDFSLLKEVFKYCKIPVVKTSFMQPHHLVIIGRKK